MGTLLKEFYRGEISDLKRYLQLPDEQKEVELMVQMSDQVLGLIETSNYIGEISLGKGEPVNHKLAVALYNDIQKNGKEQAIKSFKQKFPDVYDKIINYLRKASKDPIRYSLPKHDSQTDIPSFMYMDYIEDVKNKWLLHFTDNKDVAEKIKNQGFQKGVSDKSRLGLTAWIPDNEKDSGNTYNFAFDPDDLRHDGQLLTDLTKGRIYGSQCVMFRASGIKVFHETDNQMQVIFNSNQASDFVWIRSNWEPLGDGDQLKYIVANKLDEKIYSSDRFMKVVNWIEDNYKQYKNVL